jgi:hypothetical protein
MWFGIVCRRLGFGRLKEGCGPLRLDRRVPSWLLFVSAPGRMKLPRNSARGTSRVPGWAACVPERAALASPAGAAHLRLIDRDQPRRRHPVLQALRGSSRQSFARQTSQPHAADGACLRLLAQKQIGAQIWARGHGLVTCISVLQQADGCIAHSVWSIMQWAG